MEPIYVAAFFSFVFGLLGYIVVRFWILPIGRYIRVKDRFASDLRTLLDMLQDEQPYHTENSQIQDRRVSLRRYSSDLVSIYQKELPYWYRLYLESKKEQPLEAAEFSMRLSNTRKLEHAFRQADEIKGFLRLK
ncbi:MAG TPA: hypothetical protein DCY53_09140 [Desulfobacteraceae bacterium]|jgi:hypothetical protein|nr:hypothetical protein [Desulfobacteraceae bacterium]